MLFEKAEYTHGNRDHRTTVSFERRTGTRIVFDPETGEQSSEP
jgi:hypothetical protein